MSRADALFLQESLDVWAHVRSHDLGLSVQPLPWSVFYDATCAFHLNAPGRVPGAASSKATLTFADKRVRVQAVRHTEGMLVLPHGARVPVDVAAYASNTTDGVPFFTMALLSLWDAKKEVAGSPYFAERLVSVTSHEICHTEQLRTLAGHMKNISLGDFVNVDDDVIETTFVGNRDYAAVYGQEIDTLWHAVASQDAGERASLVRHALATAKARRDRFFIESNAPLAALEPVFISFEGLGEWVRYRFIVNTKEWREPRELVDESPAFRGYDVFRAMTGAEAIAFLRGTRPSWSQDEGLAIMLLLDELGLPNWQKRALALESPFALLEEAVAAR